MWCGLMLDYIHIDVLQAVIIGLQQRPLNMLQHKKLDFIYL